MKNANPATREEVLRQYAIALDAGVMPAPILSASEVDQAVAAVADQLCEYAYARLPDGGSLDMVDIPRGGTRATNMVLEVAGDRLAERSINVRRFSLPINNYGDGGSTAMGPRLPKGFMLPEEILSAINRGTVVTIDDILEGGKTVEFARAYLAERGALGLEPFFLFERSGRRRPYSVAGVGHALDTDGWVAGAGVMDATYGIGRNIPELHLAYPQVVSIILDTSAPTEIQERHSAFWRAIDALRLMQVDGVPAREVIESLPPMKYGDILAYG